MASASIPDTGDRPRARSPRRAAAWVSWLFGAALLGAVIYVALHFSEAKQFGQMLQHIHPAWLLVALILQALTYEAQGETWRAISRKVKWTFGWWEAFQTSLAKLFTDQALPSLGISGGVVMAQGMQAKGMPRRAVMSGVITTTVSFHVASIVSLAASVVVAMAMHRSRVYVTLAAIAFMLVEVAIGYGALKLAGHRVKDDSWLRRIKPLTGGLRFLEDADPGLARDPLLLLETSAWQLLIIVLDAATIWALVAGMGEYASAWGVFASFVFSTLFRTLAVMPGGIGTFEASSVITLRMAGVSLPAALAATLLFRGLSFYLPMLPGLWLSRRMTRGRKS